MTVSGRVLATLFIGMDISLNLALLPWTGTPNSGVPDYSRSLIESTNVRATAFTFETYILCYQRI